MLAVSNSFGVDYNGYLYANSAVISGTITAGANSKIGPWTVTTSSIYNNKSSYSTAGTYSASSTGVYIGTNGIALGNGFSVSSAGYLTCSYINLTGGSLGWDSGSYSWGVNSSGKLTATSAEISGTLTAGTGSKIGPWLITDKAIYKTSSTWGSSSSGAAYFGDDGISITNKFKVDSSGVLTCTGASFTGSINSGSTITGATISGGTVKAGRYWDDNCTASMLLDMTGNSNNGTATLIYGAGTPTSYSHGGTAFAIRAVYPDTVSLYMGGTEFLYGTLDHTNANVWPKGTWNFGQATVKGITAVFG